MTQHDLQLIEEAKRTSRYEWFRIEDELMPKAQSAECYRLLSEIAFDLYVSRCETM